jgi:hypothetical protein
MLSYEQDDGFEGISRVSFPIWREKDVERKVACQHYAGLSGKVLEEIGDPLQR